MRQLLIRFGVAIAAFAVFIVSATCSSAGCLLDVVPHFGSGTTACCERHRETPQAPAGGNHCPLCQGSPLLAKSIKHQFALNAGNLLLPVFSTPADSLIHLSPAIPLRGSAASDHVRIHGSMTLLGLHCALLI